MAMMDVVGQGRLQNPRTLVLRRGFWQRFDYRQCPIRSLTLSLGNFSRRRTLAVFVVFQVGAGFELEFVTIGTRELFVSHAV